MIKRTRIALLSLVGLCLLPFVSTAGDQPSETTILLTGASFATKGNTWFEMGCRALSMTPLNRAVGGESIANTANRMADGTLYSKTELETIDAMVINQVHDRDVFDPSQLLTAWADYTPPFDRTKYAAAYDYVIKRYLADCYALRDEPTSLYYQTQAGKPAVIVLTTHWHDARVVYNTSVRQLAIKWGIPLIEFDKHIGFSKDAPHPVTGEQQSLLHSVDKQVLGGVTHGWHPTRGENAYIQRRMAAIFADGMRRILPLKPPPARESHPPSSNKS